jgi:hypothetical protein
MNRGYPNVQVQRSPPEEIAGNFIQVFLTKWWSAEIEALFRIQPQLVNDYSSL